MPGHPAGLFYPRPSATKAGAVKTAHLHDHPEAKSAQNNQQNKTEINSRAALKTDQAVREQGKSGVAKRGNRMKKRGKQGNLPGSKLMHDDRPDYLYPDNGQDHFLQKFAQPESGIVQKGLAHGYIVGKGYLFPPQKKDQAGVSHDSQAAQLDHDQDDTLSEPGKKRPGIHHYKTGDAGGRGRGKQGVYPGYAVPGQGSRMVQDQRAGQDGRGKQNNGQDKRI